jgi:uncharacterized membrane protein YqjE
MSTHSGIAETLGSLSASIARLAQTASSYAQTRLSEADELVRIETRRRLNVLLSACGLMLGFSSALLFAGLAVVAAFWDTHRVLASALVASAFLLFAAVCGWLLLLKWRQRPTLLDWATRLFDLVSPTR